VLAIPVLGASGAALASTVAFSVTALYTVAMYRKIMATKQANASGAPVPRPLLMETSE
jgi:hypothetical protein